MAHYHDDRPNQAWQFDLGMDVGRRITAKVRHVDLASAATALAKVRKRAKPGTKVPRGVYPCGICKGWHLTSKKGATTTWVRRRLGNV